MSPVYLLGYMAAGKSTVGRLSAKQLNWHFVDLDEAFETMHGFSTTEYIREYGIEAFRQKEKYVLEDIADLSPYDNVIYATGGGYPCYEDNMDCVNELGITVYLRWKAEDLVGRLLLTDLSTRPVLQGRTRDELLECVTAQLDARTPYYEKAQLIIDAPGFVPDADQLIANQLCQLLKSKMK